MEKYHFVLYSLKINYQLDKMEHFNEKNLVVKIISPLSVSVKIWLRPIVKNYFPEGLMIPKNVD